MIALSSLMGNIAAGLWLLLIGVLGRKQSRSWLSPSTVLALFWSCAIVIPSILAPESVPGPMGVGFVVLWITLFHLGTMLAWSRPAEPVSYSSRSRLYILPFATLPVWIGVVAGLGALFLLGAGLLRCDRNGADRRFRRGWPSVRKVPLCGGVGLPVVVRALNVVLNAGVIYSGIGLPSREGLGGGWGHSCCSARPCSGVHRKLAHGSDMDRPVRDFHVRSCSASVPLAGPRLAAGLLRVVVVGALASSCCS